jgi:diguanylate cyclase (GGDEF)-like protein
VTGFDASLAADWARPTTGSGPVVGWPLMSYVGLVSGAAVVLLLGLASGERHGGPAPIEALAVWWVGVGVAAWRGVWWTGHRTAVVHNAIHVFAVAIVLTTDLRSGLLAVLGGVVSGRLLMGLFGDGVARTRLNAPASAFAVAVTTIAVVAVDRVVDAMAPVSGAANAPTLSMTAVAVLAYLTVEMLLLVPIVLLVERRPMREELRRTAMKIFLHALPGVVATYALVTSAAAVGSAGFAVAVLVVVVAAAASVLARELYRSRRVEREVLRFVERSAQAEGEDAILSGLLTALSVALGSTVELSHSQPDGSGTSAAVAWRGGRLWLASGNPHSRIARLSAGAWERQVLSAFAAAAEMALDAGMARAELRHEADHDALTGLPNRRRFLRDGRRVLLRAEQAQQPVVLCYVDLNGFKRVNDTRSHEAGDEVLKVAAEQLRSCVRPGDLVCRLGGDEFAALLVGTLDGIGAAERMSTGLARLPFGVTAAVGGAHAGHDGYDIDALLREADAAMYRDKAGTRPS